MDALKNASTTRRRFLALLGGSVTGIWLAGTGFVQVERRMVLKMTGACSFCGKRPEEVFGLAGLADRGVSICDECGRCRGHPLEPAPPRRVTGAPPRDQREAPGDAASISTSIRTRFPTTTPPAGIRSFQLTPKSLRSISVVAEKPSRRLPHGSSISPR